MISEDPKSVAEGEELHAEGERQGAFRERVVEHELREEKMRSDRDSAVVDGEAGVGTGCPDV